MTGPDPLDQVRGLIAAFNAGDVKACIAVFGFPTFVCDADGQFVLSGERDCIQYMGEMRDLVEGFGADRVAMLASHIVEASGPFVMCIVEWGFLTNEGEVLLRARTHYTFKSGEKGPKIVAIIGLERGVPRQVPPFPS